MAATNGRKPKATIDFAAFREERNQRISPIVVNFGDEELELPPNMPAAVMLDLMAFQREQQEAGESADVGNIPPEMAMNIMTAVLGNDRLQAMIRKYDLQLDELFWLMERLLLEYTDDPVGDAGNALKPLEKASTSSKSGNSSKATSKRRSASTS